MAPFQNSGAWHKSLSMIYGCGIFNKLCVLVSRNVEDVTVFMVTKHVVLKYGNTITFSSNGTSHINSIKFAA